MFSKQFMDYQDEGCREISRRSEKKQQRAEGLALVVFLVVGVPLLLTAAS